MFSSLGTILMLHRVAPYDRSRLVYNEDLKISPEELESVIVELKNKQVDWLSLADLVTLLKSGKKPVRKFAIITLDDGYRDNLEFGYPIFKKHGVPFCIYVTNSFPNRTSTLWWYALEKLIAGNPFLRNAGGSKLDNGTEERRRKNFIDLRSDVLSGKFRDPLAYFQQRGDLDFDLPALREELCLTWEEIITLSKDPLTTIGAHTLNHYPLSQLLLEEVQAEIGQSRDELALKLERKISDFAFPFGGRAEAWTREYDVAAEAGFDSITTTIHGHIHSHDNLHHLDRIFLYPMSNHSTTLNRVLYRNPKTFISYFRKWLS